MSGTGIPKGYHTITPNLIVRGALEAIEFYQRAFGAENLGAMTGPDGKVMHAEIRVGDSIVMLSDENEAWGAKSPMSTNGNSITLHVYVQDADAAFARAVEAGARPTMPVMDAFWGDRYGQVMDPYGHQWSIAHRQKNLSDAEIRQAAEEWMSQMGAQAE